MTPQPPAPGPQQKTSKTLIAVIIIAVVGGCCIIGGGISAAVAIPNFIRYKSRAKQAECKVALRSIYTAERALYAEKQIYSENPETAGIFTEGKNYVYVMSREGAPLGSAANATELAAAARGKAAGALGVSGACPKCEFTAACAGNIDNDPDVDLWTVSTAERTAADGHTISPGEVYNDYSDVTDSPGR